MVKKVILKLGKNNDINNEYNIDDILYQNNELYNVVKKHKDMISIYYKNKLWDKFKKLGNEYERIFTRINNNLNISTYLPISRSFFKLWEILYDFKDIIFKDSESIRCLFLAEGPGGFAESLIKFRKDNFKNIKDNYYGMTLKSNNDKNIPDWNFNNNILDNVKIIYGEDDTGNLYNYNNIDNLRKRLSSNSIDFITADGGFDFSSDFNGQEELSLRLILCEILTAFLLQKEDGCFILKIFDMFNENTLKYIHILREFYEVIYIVKPLTSRPANSEKYLICSGFRKNGLNNYSIKIIDDLINLVKDYNQDNLEKIIKSIKYDGYLLNNLYYYNVYYSIRQIFYIQKTIYYINKFSVLQKQNFVLMNEIMNDHIRKSQKWCKKYNISFEL